MTGRFSNERQVLTLTGLDAGQPYLLTLDLYILDSWEGPAVTSSPDVLTVFAESTPVVGRSTMARRLVTMSGRTLVTQYTRQMAKIASAFCPSGGSPAGGSITRRTRNAASPTSRTVGR